jgi:hypothetical protein
MDYALVSAKAKVKTSLKQNKAKKVYLSIHKTVKKNKNVSLIFITLTELPKNRMFL